MVTAAAGTTPRQYYIDNLRNLAVLALILFHTARLFDSESWHMKNATAYRAADLVVAFFNPWHMPLLFFLAGTSAAYSLRKRPAGRFIGERVNRLLVPFAAGIVLTVLPQVYLERISPAVPNRASPFDFDGSLFAFVPRFFQMVPYPKGDFSWHHLWFLIYLMIYSILLAPLLAWMARSAAPERLGAWLTSGWRPMLPLLPLAIFEMALRPSFPLTNALINDWANHANYVTVLLLGGLMAASPSFAAAMGRVRSPALVAALLLTVVWLTGRSWGPAVLGTGLRPSANLLRAALEWVWIIALVGYARLLLDRSVPFLTGFTRYALPFYIFHQAVIVWLGWVTFGWSDMPVAKYLAIAALALVISYALARLFDLTAVTRFLIGLKAPRRPAA